MNNRGLTVKLNGSEIKDAVREGIREYKAEQCGNRASIGNALRTGDLISYTVKPI